MYNGRYDRTIEVVLKTETHQLCLDLSKKVKSLCNAWVDQEVSFTERKSANKGDVLYRSIMIRQIGYGHSIIIFRESLECILSYQIFLKQVTIHTRHTHPIDKHLL
jgi:hypothetical protein